MLISQLTVPWPHSGLIEGQLWMHAADSCFPYMARAKQTFYITNHESLVCTEREAPSLQGDTGLGSTIASKCAVNTKGSFTLCRMELAEYLSPETHITISYLLSFCCRFSLSSWRCSYTPLPCLWVCLDSYRSSWYYTRYSSHFPSLPVVSVWGTKNRTEDMIRFSSLHKWVRHWEHQGTMFPGVSSDKF